MMLAVPTYNSTPCRSVDLDISRPASRANQQRKPGRRSAPKAATTKSLLRKKNPIGTKKSSKQAMGKRVSFQLEQNETFYFKEDLDYHYDANGSPVLAHKQLRSLPPDSPTSVATSLSAPFWEDSSIQRSRIYIKRAGQAASVIQALIRGFLQRKHYYIALLDKRRQERRQKKQAMRNAAATTIQAACRGWMGRMHARIVYLEARIRETERQKFADLRQIQRWKRQQKAEAQKMVDAYMDSFFSLKAQSNLAMDTIEELQKQYLLLKAKNEELELEVEEAKDEARRLEKENRDCVEATHVVRPALTKLVKENTQWQQVHDAYETKVEQVLDWINERECKCMVEERQHRLYRKVVKAMVESVELLCEDFSLVEDVQEVYATGIEQAKKAAQRKAVAKAAKA